MNKITLTLILLITTITFAQNKEKVKGSKIVTIEKKEIGNFNAIEVEDDLEVYLETGEKQAIKIEADENLHEIIATDLEGDVLHLHTSKEAVNYKKLIVRVIYTKDLNLVTARNKSTINAIEKIELEDITFKTFDDSKCFLNVESKIFELQADNDSKIELNLKSEKAKIVLSKNTSLKSLINSTELAIDLYQKANAKVEGDFDNLTIRLDNNSNFNGNKLTGKNIDITTEGHTKCSVYAENNIIIDARDKSEIEIYGKPKVEIRQFSDEAKLLKK